ncbi:dephospho-CoA kinase [Paenibacillus sp. FSL A5-0031]|uniref:dephospho-CoA kinase n=1 Tax=Paenibacillus sp. FSL A5-0031 TaxID=1920420 RepID=UPI00096CC0A3|nr:dephospho-CoA kinase [Paenibacillus sp. FSL A5-0031]OME77918.1 dephospho-CoA kinase [Paenibacillus sp. FSL A5-0031]
MIIGLTGGIASGKSTIANMLVERGALLVDADQVAREVVLPGEPALEAIASTFGQAVLETDGSLNRKALGEIVFRDKQSLAKLESITHPAIRARMQQTIHTYAEHYPERLVVADVPLLYETKQENLYEGILVVYVPAELQKKRLMERNQLPEEEASRRIALQMDIEQKRLKADWVIDNSGSLEETKRQLDEFWKSKCLP